MQRANEYPLPRVIGRSLYACLVLWAIYRIATGRFRWAIAAFILIGLHIFGAVAYSNKTPELARVGLGIFSLQALFLTIALLVYRGRTEETGYEQQAGQVSVTNIRTGRWPSCPQFTSTGPRSGRGSTCRRSDCYAHGREGTLGPLLRTTFCLGRS